MEKTRREYPEIAPAGANYSRAVKAGNLLFISGCTAKDTDAHGGPPLEQLRVTLDKLVRIVAAEGGVPQDIVQTTTFVTRMADWFPPSDDQQALFTQFFGSQKPTSSLVEITALAQPGLDIEIEAIAVLE